MADEPRPKRLVPADWVLKRIQEGKNVRLRNAVIEGDLDINKLDLPTRHVKRSELQKQMGLAEDVKIVQSSISISNSTIQGQLDFRNSTFNEDAGFGGATFNGDARFRGATFSGNTWFRGATFNGYAEFQRATFSKDASFKDATFSTDAWFRGATFSGNTWFRGATFNGYAEFQRATFSKDASFKDATFSTDAWFRGATFNGYTEFQDVLFSGEAPFTSATFSGNTWFQGTTFNGYAGFRGVNFSGNASFRDATFKGKTSFDGDKFEGDFLTFQDANFVDPKHQEDACRRAKNVLEKNGDREEAGSHFYREMDGKRKQKPWYIRYPEFIFIQTIFGYGVHPLRLWVCWIGFVLLFAAIYSLGNGIDATASQLKGEATLIDYVWFSIATAVTPGYAGYKPTADFKLVAGLEAILGTFMWAAFIATFARKYMR